MKNMKFSEIFEEYEEKLEKFSVKFFFEILENIEDY
jgi:hypothetical protein